MLNNLSSPLSLLETRRSGRAREMTGPGPTADQLRQMLTIAARTPDHGKLSPWRFVIVDHDKREDFAELLHRGLNENHVEAGPAHHQKAEDFAHHGEALVVLLSAPIEGHKIPVWEQELSCGAVGMNLLLAGHALGFVGSWLTGWAAYDPTVRSAFCTGNERIAGFFFFGSPALPVMERVRPDLDTLTWHWDAPLR